MFCWYDLESQEHQREIALVLKFGNAFCSGWGKRQVGNLFLSSCVPGWAFENPQVNPPLLIQAKPRIDELESKGTLHGLTRQWGGSWHGNFTYYLHSALFFVTIPITPSENCDLHPTKVVFDGAKEVVTFHPASLHLLCQELNYLSHSQKCCQRKTKPSLDPRKILKEPILNGDDFSWMPRNTQQTVPVAEKTKKIQVQNIPPKTSRFPKASPPLK